MFVFLMNCKGSDGDVGPAGPKGDTGAAGPAGVNAAGAMIYASGPDTTDAKGMLSLDVNNLTAEQEKTWNTSVVMAYVKASGIYYSLPSNVIFGQGLESQFDFYYGIAEKTFYAEMPQTSWMGKKDTDKVPPVRIVEDVRIVVIPATVQRMNAAVKWKDYQQTITALGLSEKNVISLKKITK